MEPEVTNIYLEPFFAHFDTCCICECDVQRFMFQPNYSIPLYEDVPVPVEWDGEWGGFAACKPCFDLYESGKLPMWTIEDLTYSTYMAAKLPPVCEPRK